jgi:hypothetical protein
MELILYGHDGCCLCERLEEMLRPHLAALRKRGVVDLIKRDIANDANWQELYGERIPVLIAAGDILLEGRPEAAEVRAAFERLAIR